MLKGPDMGVNRPKKEVIEESFYVSIYEYLYSDKAERRRKRVDMARNRKRYACYEHSNTLMYNMKCTFHIGIIGKIFVNDNAMKT